jgi:predicted small lipoprotein YifL
MIRSRLIAGLLCCCLLLSVAGCGNKGPLVLPDQQDQDKERQKTREY